MDCLIKNRHIKRWVLHQPDTPIVLWSSFGEDIDTTAPSPISGENTTAEISLNSLGINNKIKNPTFKMKVGGEFTPYTKGGDAHWGFKLYGDNTSNMWGSVNYGVEKGPGETANVTQSDITVSGTATSPSICDYVLENPNLECGNKIIATSWYEARAYSGNRCNFKYYANRFGLKLVAWYEWE